MVKVRMVRTGLTIGGQVRLQGEVLELPLGLPTGIEEQKTYYRKGIIHYVEVESPEEKMALAMGGMVTERDAFSTDKMIKPGFAAPDESPPGMKTEQVPEQPTDEEMEAEMELKSAGEEVEDDGLEDMSKKELRELIEAEGLQVKEYNTRTKKENLISRIRGAKE